MSLIETKLPQDIQNIITWNLLLLFVIAFYHMTYYDNVSKIECLNQFYVPNISQDYGGVYSVDNYKFNISLPLFQQSIDASNNLYLRQQIIDVNSYIEKADFYIYFLLIPIMNILYGIWCLRKGLLRMPYIVALKGLNQIG